MFSRTVVGIQTGAADAKVEQSTKLPEVFLAPIRADLVQSVHTNMRKNSRQAYAVSKYAGKDSSAESWGTGRAVARIPRVAGGGTHRAGQGAFGNMCRGGRRFAPTKTWRRWHRMTNITQKRFAVAAAIAASAVPALVTARGHQIESVAEIPLVVSNKAFDSIVKTSQAVAFLKAIKASDDVDKVKESIHLRKGIGKMRNRRFVQRRGPLVVYNQNGPLVKAFRNIPGVELANVNSISLLQLAPGGHVGRFIIWVEDAFNKLNQIFGTYKTNSEVKTGYRLPRSIVTNPDISKIIQSDEIFAYLKDKKTSKTLGPKRNPLKNIKALTKLNQYGASVKRSEFALQQQRNKKKAQLLEAKRSGKTIEPTAAEKKILAAQKKNKDALKKRVKPQAKAFGKALSAK